MLVSNFNGLTQKQMNELKIEKNVSEFLWHALYDNINNIDYKNGMIIPEINYSYEYKLSDKIIVEVDLNGLIEGYNNFDYIDYYDFNNSCYSSDTITNHRYKIFKTKNMQDFILQLKVFLYKYLTKFQRIIYDYELHENEEEYIPLDSDVITDINNYLVQEMFN